MPSSFGPSSRLVILRTDVRSHDRARDTDGPTHRPNPNTGSQARCHGTAIRYAPAGWQAAEAHAPQSHPDLVQAQPLQRTSTNERLPVRCGARLSLLHCSSDRGAYVCLSMLVDCDEAMNERETQAARPAKETGAKSIVTGQ